jgi:hypothetical protein
LGSVSSKANDGITSPMGRSCGSWSLMAMYCAQSASKGSQAAHITTPTSCTATGVAPSPSIQPSN